MLPIPGQKAGLIVLSYFVDTHGWPRGVMIKKFCFNFFSTDNAGFFS